MTKDNFAVVTRNRFAELLSEDESETKNNSLEKVMSQLNKSSVLEPARQSQIIKEKKTSSPLNRQRGLLRSNGDENLRPVACQSKSVDNNQGSSQNRSKTSKRHGVQKNRDRDIRASNVHGRIYDRHSGTGRGKEMKKLGGGGHNWGNETIDYEVLCEESKSGSKDKTLISEQNREHQNSPNNLLLSHNTQQENTNKLSPEKKQFEKCIDFTEYMRAQRQKRANLLSVESSNTKTSILSSRLVNSDELENDGYQRYERDETLEERTVREQQYIHRRGVPRDEDSEEEPAHRQRTYNLSEFNGHFLHYNSTRGKRGGHGHRTGREMYEKNAIKNSDTYIQNASIDITDTSAFPSLV